MPDEGQMGVGEVLHDIGGHGQAGMSSADNPIGVVIDLAHGIPGKNPHDGAERDDDGKAKGDSFLNSPVFHNIGLG